MIDKTENEKPLKESNQTLHEEPSLFEAKSSGGGKWKMKLFLIVLFSALGFLFWPKGYMSGEAVVQAGRFARMGLTNSGILKEVLHEKGNVVPKGELLVRFENPELARKLEERTFALEIMSHDKARIQREFEFLGKDKERKSILYENGVVGRIHFDKAGLELLKAQGELAMRTKEIESTEAEIHFLKGRVESLEFRAPFNGMLLTDPGIAVGNFLKEGDFVLEFADPKSFFLELLVSEKQISKIESGSEALVNFRAFPWKTYSGEITKIGPRTTEKVEKVFNVQYVIPCEIRLHDMPVNLKYGMRAWVRIGGRRRAVSKLPPQFQEPEQTADRFLNPKVLEAKKTGIGS